MFASYGLVPAVVPRVWTGVGSVVVPSLSLWESPQRNTERKYGGLQGARRNQIHPNSLLNLSFDGRVGVTVSGV